MTRHPSKSLGICAPRKTPSFTDQPYILVRDGVKLAGHDTIGALLRNVEDKGPGCRILRTKDGVCVWPAECVKEIEST